MMQKPSGDLELRFFGPAELRLGDKVLPHPRTQKELWVLALLSLRQGRAVQRDWLAETLWPESLMLRAQYNLRRGLSELRHALGAQATVLLSPTVRTLQLDTEACWIDILCFDAAIKRGDSASLEEAVSLYTGPLLEGCQEEWVLPERRLRQEQCLSALEQLAQQRAQPSKQEPYLRRALALDPARESAARSLMELLAQQGSQTGVMQVYRDLRTHLRDQFSTTPSAETQALYQRLLTKQPPLPRLPRKEESVATIQEPPGGPLPPNSPYYVSRLSDRLFHEALVRGDSLALLKGPRQTGKSSLLARGLGQMRQTNTQVRVTNFQRFPPEVLATAEQLYFQLRPEGAAWEGSLPPGEALEKAIRAQLLAHPEQHFIWALDGLDSVFAQPWHNDFFALLRAWHNERAFEPAGPWRRLTLALTYSTEAHLFISDPNQSPFNVGTRLFLTDFTHEETSVLYNLYKQPLASLAEKERFMALTGGHPYLISQGLYALASQQATLEALESGASYSSPFRDHLRRLEKLLETPELREGTRAVLAGQPVEPDLFFRLRSSGVLAGELPSQARIRCGLYKTHLESILR